MSGALEPWLRISCAPFLIVSLPDNDVDLAKAAIDGGAHALKVHLNVEHRASGSCYGDLGREWDRLLPILEAARLAGVVMGVMPGADVFASQEDIQKLVSHGVSFIDAYVPHLPVWALGLAKPRVMAALGPDDRPGSAMILEQLGADAIEASIVRPEFYGQSLKVSDLMTYRTLVNQTRLPVVVPTQKAIRPEEVPTLLDTGVRGLMIGAIVTGSTPDSLGRATAVYRRAIDH